ncbi:hypothetical protein GL58_00720 [Comamonas testosteroni]|uniref:Protein kinase domain-containing protein n=1 Tax=Comamonas testosteroni TaxID=285 RepID=A0A0L7MVL2_COMTE|nr:serine/threonine-protein kinase [Comamonas testosteroni]KOC25956.1 hypothetical protein GL58_00720 [Comamonas testosteroni]
MINPYTTAQVSFEIKQEIGHEGKNSTAFVAHDKQLDAEVAIKKVAKETLDVALYFQEAKTLYFSNHPNVVQVHYACQDDEHIYLAMPFYSKGSLKNLMKTRFLTVREIVRFGCNIASGLHNIHSKGLVHFDVKPDNVLISDRGEGLLSDFGLARMMNASGMAGQDRLYSKMLPPEAFTQPEHGVLFDIYQFGVTLYRMCNGDSAFYGQLERFGSGASLDRHAYRHALVNGQFPDRSAFLEHIPLRLRKVIKSCMDPEMANRPQSAIEVANELGLVDERLDWQYTEAAGTREWSRTKPDGVEYKLSVHADGTSIAKRGKLGGRYAQLSPYSKPKISNAEIQGFLKSQ